MSVRVNLLPSATREKDAANQQRLFAGLAAIVLLAVLGGVYLWGATQITSAEEELADAQSELATLRSREGDLAIFADIDQRVNEADQRLATNLNGEVSVAGVLQDVALVTPGDAGLTGLSVTITRPTDAPTRLVGSLNVSGQSLGGIAPGVERLLLNFDKVATFDEPLFNSSTVDVDGVASFSMDVGLLPLARTERYADGLPEELRR
ncbi:MAG: hypothetical protein JJT89_14665 [Nitriliruptoraceae bacterium]|nr:hypothetical protein [Nitriliruptoraceae bacterium]